MSKQISPILHVRGADLYAVVFDADFQIWKPSGSAFEAYNPDAGADQDDYDIAVTEAGSGIETGVYSADFPSAILPGLYRVVVFEKVGADPDATSDTPVWGIEINWDGAAAVPLRPMPMIFGNINDAGADADDFDGNSGLSSTDDFYNGCLLVFRTGALAGIPRRISDYVGSSRNLSFADPFPTSPSDGDKFNILGRID